MRRWMKITIGVAAGLALLAGAAGVVGTQMGESRMHRKVEVAVQPVAYVDDARSLERGRYLFASRGCVDCHGADGAGRSFVEDAGAGLHIRGANITRGPGGVVADYRPEDWVRAIRHGVAPGGRPLMVMPSEDYNRLTDDDLAALVAHVRALPPVAGGPAIVQLPLPARVLYGWGAMQDAAAKIDHSLPPAQPVPEGVTKAHGAYVANMCLGCHGPQLAGGRIPGAPPDWPAASRLAPGEGSAMERYPDADSLIRLFRTGRRADGAAVRVMPFESLREVSDTDMRALHLYLRSLPAAAG